VLLGLAAAYSEVRVMDDAAFALPRNVKFEDCLFYHTVDIPGHGVVRGQWDLRQQVDTYLGGYRFAGKRVLEIGPASGFLTCENGAPKAANKEIDQRRPAALQS
jgi:hypothetical protein